MSESMQPTGETTHPNEYRCRNCGAFVTQEFARVFGNNDDEVFGCLDCMSATKVKNGGASAEDADGSSFGR
ncbi:DUF7563 family protein [Haladaptatus salinisoli]|uniref:DUF7563 family protein n=1 Tax=Haladaptatus salinisoli TaxID=2884876 RepID=UPI001D0A93BF|nr:hypothetical protein [Haladaptatus salinisoli]